MKDTKTRVLIVDDHPVLRQGMAALINEEKDFVICGEADDPKSGLAAIQNTNPDIVILDISLKNRTSGFDALKDFKLQFPNLQILMLSMHDEIIYGPLALKAGASGYIMKH